MLYESPTAILSATVPCAPCEPLPALLPRQITLEQVRALEAYGKALPPERQIDPNAGLRHFFARGMYGREYPLPAGACVVGKMHRHEHLTFLLSGTCQINTDRGMETITGPHVWVSPPGAKRAVLAHTDCLFFTVHLNPTDTEDLTLIEAEHIVPESVPVLESTPEFADFLQGVYA